MTYFQFLGLFILIPLLVLLVIQRNQLTRARIIALFILATVAVVYTTIWDNYLVANRIWWYDPDLVAGITLGWVPIEEYLFFILETFLVGLWFLFLWPRMHQEDREGAGSLRWILPGALGLVWVFMVGVLVGGWAPGRYMALELVWALPPIILQLAYGADLLWRNWKLILMTILSATLYLSLADWIAIQAGIWTISSRYTVGLIFGGVLPLEEVLFFLLTVTLIVFGLYLALAPASHQRLRQAAVRRREEQGSELVLKQTL